MSTTINPAMQSLASIQMGRSNLEPTIANQDENFDVSGDMSPNVPPVTQVTLSNANQMVAPLDYLDLQPTQQVQSATSAQDMTNEQNTTMSGLTYASALQAESNFFSLQSSANLDTPDSEESAMN
jgi:hypothetical protein